jgi:hypothetical protein
MEEIWVKIINKYINFYKDQVKNVNLFDGIKIEDFGSTNKQMELFHAEVEKYKTFGEDFQSITEITKNINLKKYVITQNSNIFCTSDSLLSLLIEIINLENEDDESKYDLLFSFSVKNPSMLGI